MGCALKHCNLCCRRTHCQQGTAGAATGQRLADRICPALQQAASKNVHIEFVAICGDLEPAEGDVQAAAELSAFGVALEGHENASLQWCRLGESSSVPRNMHLLPCMAQPCCITVSAVKPLAGSLWLPEHPCCSTNAACHTCHSACSGAGQLGRAQSLPQCTHSFFQGLQNPHSGGKAFACPRPSPQTTNKGRLKGNAQTCLRDIMPLGPCWEPQGCMPSHVWHLHVPDSTPRCALQSPMLSRPSAFSGHGTSCSPSSPLCGYTFPSPWAAGAASPAAAAARSCPCSAAWPQLRSAPVTGCCSGGLGKVGLPYVVVGLPCFVARLGK